MAAAKQERKGKGREGERIRGVVLKVIFIFIFLRRLCRGETSGVIGTCGRELGAERDLVRGT